MTALSRRQSFGFLKVCRNRNLNQIAGIDEFERREALLLAGAGEANAGEGVEMGEVDVADKLFAIL